MPLSIKIASCRNVHHTCTSGESIAVVCVASKCGGSLKASKFGLNVSLAEGGHCGEFEPCAWRKPLKLACEPRMGCEA